MGNNNYWGFLGTVCLQMSSIPSVIQAAHTGETAPLSTIVLIILGLLACAVQEFQAKMWAYFAGSIIGIVGNVSICIILALR